MTKHIILLRGLAREAAHWLDFPAQLQQTLGDGARLHLVDFPGCGTFFREPPLGSVAAMTDHLRRQPQIEAVIAGSDPVFVVGISMGGMVALDWAQRFPQELGGVALINSSSGNQPLWWRLRPGAWLTMVNALFSEPGKREARVLARVSNNTAGYAHHLQQWLSIQQQRPVTRATIIAMLRAAAKFRPQPSCDVDGLVLTSVADRMVSTRASEALAQQFHWPLRQHASAGHDLPMDDPEWLVTHLSVWINQHV